MSREPHSIMLCVLGWNAIDNSIVLSVTFNGVGTRMTSPAQPIAPSAIGSYLGALTAPAAAGNYTLQYELMFVNNGTLFSAYGNIPWVTTIAVNV